MLKVTLLGNGGHAKVIKDIIDRLDNVELFAILDGKIENKYVESTVIYDSMNNLFEYKDTKFIIAIGNNRVREKLVKQFHLSDSNFISLVDPSAVISPNATIGIGTVVMPNAVINADAKIGKHSIINSSAIVEHDNEIGDFTHISPGAILSGTVTVGEFTHIGSGSVVIPNINIGSYCIIGAGSVIIRDIESDVTAVGNPARIIKRSE
ncbi:acetyltransferase [Macrococcoides caseolyticum]|uniref:Acetyltransferase n=1 Tax=Macrococcoides caseolyticum TaxID=69966 RepID=A0ACC9MUF3_9STAP|nr:acetyltransferase [Macrococcus caseolyticus]PKE20294.1 acetyltransferase [Macrococcus caseolyticus]PKE40263.1 acetyltransferase [Macrococcus caseolyticus]PKE57431.1 acetyltransferase [Macrococcus caseolyticus]PKF41248.1 acetyltransferase [Macrococcus caseolyticus]QQB05553.1 acetyltransferase [Macrococcus caseolyticus]